MDEVTSDQNTQPNTSQSTKPIDDLKTVAYRPIIHKLFWFSLLILLMIELIIYRLHYKDLESAGMVFGSVKFIIASSVPLGILLRLLIIVRPRIFTRFKLSINSLILFQSKKENEIHYSQVKELRKSFLSPIFLGGFVIVLNSGKKLFFSSIIRNDYLILEGLKKYSPNLMPEDSFNELIISTKKIDSYWSHIQSKLKNPKYLGLKLLSSPITSLAVAYTLFSQSNPEKLDLLEPSFHSYLFLGSFLLNVFSGIWASHIAYQKKCLNKEGFNWESHLKWNELLHFLLNSILTTGLVYLVLTIVTKS